MAEVLGARPAAVARELTKMFEETRRATRSASSPRITREPARRKGRSSSSLARRLPKGEVSDEALDAFLAGVLSRGVKEAASEAARDLGVPRKRAYARALELKDRA